MSALVTSVGESDSVLAFGPFCLRPRRRQLERGQFDVKIGSRALDLLIALAERPGEVLGQRELVDRVWPDTAVEESALRVQIAGLRKALGAAHGARYIATVPGRGYCFVAEVRRLEEELRPAAERSMAPAEREDRHAAAVDERISPAVSLLVDRISAESETAPLTVRDLLAIEQLCRHLDSLAGALRSAAGRFAIGR